QLREDNADLRLTALGRELGLVDDLRWDAFARKRDAIDAEHARLAALWLAPGNALGAAANETLGMVLQRETAALDLLRRPEIDYQALVSVPGIGPGVADPAVSEQVQIAAKYSGYLQRQDDEIARQRGSDALAIPDGFD